MVKRCVGDVCVNHPENCDCAICEAAQSVVVTEQGVFGDLLSEYNISVDPSLKSVK